MTKKSKRVLSAGFIFMFFLASGLSVAGADERDEELAVLKTQVQELLKRIEKLETEQAKVTEAVKKEGEKPLLTKLAEALQPGYAKEGQLKFKGYVQARYEWFESDSSSNTFKLKSAYIIPYGTIIPGWDFEIEIDAADTAGKPLRNAFIEYTAFKPYVVVRAGQQKPSYSEEFLTSSSTIDTIERALPVTNLSAERDIGVNIFGKLLKEKIEYGIGVFNGSGINTTDNNDNQDIVGRVVVAPFKGSKNALDGLRVGSAFWVGRQPLSGTSRGSRERYAGLLAYTFKRLKLQGEYLFQSLEQTNNDHRISDGWYVMGVYDLIRRKGDPALQLVGKYEAYEPNRSATEDKLYISTLGVNYFFNKYVKIMANYRFRDEETDRDNDEFLTQFQVKF